ncbi:MAG TPA: hypothetical protein VEK57_20365 [Thermoanaerobaculia bacterium]|nr:hypothetical protein [Thermoanaerobaculia bacterium]
MKRTWLLSLAFATLPLVADEPKKKVVPKPPAAAVPQAAPIAATDSPLVRAAKLANRLGRKPTGPVITNATLSRSGGNAHVSTTASQAPILLPPGPPPAPTPEMVHAENQAKARQQQRGEDQKKATARAEEEQRRAQAATAIDDGYAEGAGIDDAEVVVSGADGKPPV